MQQNTNLTETMGGKPSKVLETFYGKYVNIIIKGFKSVHEVDKGVFVEGQVITEGFLIEEDDTYYYLSDKFLITDAVKKSSVLRITLSTFPSNDKVIPDDSFDEDGSLH